MHRRKIRRVVGISFFLCLVFFRLSSAALATNEIQITDPTDFDILTADTGALSAVTLLAGSQMTSLDAQSNYIDITLDAFSTVTLSLSGSHRFFKVTQQSGSSAYTVQPAHLTTSAILTGTGAQAVLRIEVATTDSFSTQTNAQQATGGGGIDTHILPIALAPSADPSPRPPLTFSVNDGLTTTNASSVTLHFNADPKTVKGYAASLDRELRNTGILPYRSNAPYQLPSNPGTYTIYLRFYSITGDVSPLLSRTITYAPTIFPIVQPPAAKVTSVAILFKRSLSLGSKGEDVKRLQQFLNTHGFMIARQGPGSLGKETILFGQATQRALMRFQQAHADILLKPWNLKTGTGYFGPSTLRFVNGLLK